VKNNKVTCHYITPTRDSGKIEKTRNITIQHKQASNACYLLTILLKSILYSCKQTIMQ